MKKLINLPNLISFLRLPLAILTIIYFNSYMKYIFFAVACFTDWLDGFLARKLRQTSAFGTQIDPIFDRIYLVTVFIYIFINYKLPIFYLFFFFVRDIFNAIGVIVIFASGLIKKVDVKARYLGKVVTFLQFCIILYLFVGFKSYLDLIIYSFFIISLACIVDYIYYFVKTATYIKY